MTTLDKLHLSWDQNPSVREALGDKKLGDKCTIELHLQVDDINPDGADFTIEAAVPEGYELSENEDDASSPGTIPNDATPVGMVVKSRKAARQSPPPQPSRVAMPPTL